MYGRPGIRNYQEVTLNTITPERMIVMLYEGIFRNLETARKAIAAGDIAARTLSVNKAQAIISELKSSLDHDCGATFTHDLDALYNFMFSENIELLLDNDTGHIDNIRRVLEPIYKSWCEIPKGETASSRQSSQQENSGPDPARDEAANRRFDRSDPYSNQRSGDDVSLESAETHKTFCVAV